MLLLVLLSGAYLRRADVSHNFYSLQAASFSNTFPRGNPALSLELRLSPFQTLYFELHSAMETERVPETSLSVPNRVLSLLFHLKEFFLLSVFPGLQSDSAACFCRIRFSQLHRGTLPVLFQDLYFLKWPALYFQRFFLHFLIIMPCSVSFKMPFFKTLSYPSFCRCVCLLNGDKIIGRFLINKFLIK